MKIRVHLFAGFRIYAPNHPGAFLMELPPFSSVQTLLQFIGIPLDEERVILINGRHGKDDIILTDGDAVAIFPPMTGG
ncbi:MAG TPA: MoaD/ThiS family protein [Desulfatirhabdiaceae bacterium]|nr:MoaD/ThiS family protein [Desulfatirhabdiaceae bacterium]